MPYGDWINELTTGFFLASPTPSRSTGKTTTGVGKGENVSITFDTPGTYSYVCTLHSQDMDGEAIVK